MHEPTYLPPLTGGAFTGSDAVLDGEACARCACIGGMMDPIADGPRGPIYQHIFDLDCSERGRDD